MLISSEIRSALGRLLRAPGCLFDLLYAPGSFADKMVESFADIHDWLNAPHYYDATGMNLPSGLAGGEGWNYLNVILAQPVGLSTLNDQTSVLAIMKAGQDQTRRDLAK